MSFVLSITNLAYNPEHLPKGCHCSDTRKCPVNRTQVVVALGIANQLMTLWKGFFFAWNVVGAEATLFVAFQFLILFTTDTFLPLVYNF